LGCNNLRSLVGQAFSLPDFCHRLLKVGAISDDVPVVTSALVIAPDQTTGSLVYDQLRLLGGGGSGRSLDSYPDPSDVAGLLHVYMPDIVFVHCMDFRRAVSCIAAIQESGLGTPVVAVGCPPDPDKIMTVIRSGAMEVMPLPIGAAEVADVRENLSRLLAKHKPNYTTSADTHCFLPARPGVGASVLAVNAACAAAAVTGKRVLLCDLDPSLGMASFLMKAPELSSLEEALGNVGRLDEAMWKRFAYRRNGIDLLAAGSMQASGMRTEDLTELFRFASRLYDIIFLDFSGALEPFCVDLMQWARHLYLVTTPEIPALHFGRLKVETLRKAGMQDRLSVLLNRDSRAALSRKEIEDLLRCPVAFTFSNDYKRVNAAALAGVPIEAGSELGTQVREFAASITGTPKNITTGSKKRGFRDLFLPSRPAASPIAG
jgi:pilus assembly protein CpaE